MTFRPRENAGSILRHKAKTIYASRPLTIEVRRECCIPPTADY